MHFENKDCYLESSVNTMLAMSISNTQSESTCLFILAAYSPVASGGGLLSVAHLPMLLVCKLGLDGKLELACKLGLDGILERDVLQDDLEHELQHGYNQRSVRALR